MQVQRGDMGRYLAVEECYTIYRGDLIQFGTHSLTGLPTRMRTYIFYSDLTASLAGTYDINHGKGLGSGAFGVVNLTVHRIKGTIHAVKTIKADPFNLELPENLRLTHEISAMEALRDHPGICRIEEVFFDIGNITHIVMEYAAGGNLYEYIHANIRNNLSEGDIKAIAYQICSAMEYAHSKGVVHRDLKPENILLTNDKTPVVKITDFGAAEFFGETSVMTDKVGTKLFWAPEILILPSEGYSHLVDCWSMGITLLFMFTTHRNLNAQCLLPSTTLKSNRITREAQVFTADFLHFIPSLRATFTKALSSPWLQSYRRQVLRAVPLGNWNGKALNKENIDPAQRADAIEKGITKIHPNQERE
ncbi:Serine/threonine-protein kinase Chk2 [Psilocybe cubensis]|uniref:Protein kinase domain-containing protein n=2 Tax=Psilocybe cubensis TaxID=181762 RepID=A0A8H7XPZ3_PSICU|nr:Serine/threonine-protein kinase Chk2 [Psilocybe cubensis]KAH9477522.1 Serine/threonine-protein kinase Chk2 [Psilocybe cubensis]